MATAIGQMTQMPRVPGVTPTPPKSPGESYDPLIQAAEAKRAPIAEKIALGETQELQEKQRTAEYEAQTKARQARGIADIESAKVKQLEEAPGRKEVEALGKQERDFFFQPGERDGMSLATTASLMMVIGMSLGKGGKFSAMNALSGLNGMMQGHRQRSDELYKQEKQQFESNAKALRDKLSFAIQALERYEKDVIRNADVAKQNLSADLAKEGLDFVKQRGERAPIISQLPELRKSLASLDKQLGDYQSKKAAAEENYRREKQRLEDQRLLRSEAFSYQMQGMLARFAEQDRVRAEKASKAASNEKPPAKEVLAQNQLRNTLIPKIEEAIPVLDRINQEGNWGKLTGALAVDPRAAEYIFRDDPEALNLILTLAYFRSKEFETAGKALTKKEDQILAPIVRGDLRVYEGLRNAMVNGLSTLKNEQRGLEMANPYLKKFNEAYRSGGSETDVEKERANANNAIAQGANAEAVKARFKQKTGQEL